jgi:hypothetical protein
VAVVRQMACSVGGGPPPPTVGPPVP